MQSRFIEKFRHRRGGSKVVLAAGAALLCLTGRTHAQTFNWSETTDGGDFNTNSDWQQNAVPQSSNTTQLVFAPGNYSVSNDLNPFVLNSLTINNTDPTTNTISITGNALTFDGANPTLTLTGGSANVSAPMISTAGMLIQNTGAGQLLLNSQNFGGTTTIVNSGAGNITLADSYNFGPAYYGTNVLINLENTGNGTLNIGNIGPSTGVTGSGVSGTVNVSAGAVSFAGSTSGDLFGNSLILNVASGASFNFANNGETFGGITGAGNIILGTASLTLVEKGDRTFSGNISGTGGLTQNVASVLTLAGTNNNYSGGTTVTGGGTIRAAGPNVFSPNSVVTVTNGLLDLQGYQQTIAGLAGANNFGQPLALASGTLAINPVSTGSYFFYSSITGGVNVTIGGPGTESLLGSNGYTGATTVNQGSLRLNAVGLGTSGITLASGTTLYAAYGSNASWTTPISGTGTFVKEGPGTVTFSTSTLLSPPTLNLSAGSVVFDQTTDNGAKLGTPTLALNGGSFSLLGSNNAASTQTFNGTIAFPGSAEIAVTSGNNQTTTLALGNYNRNIGSAVDFTTNNPTGGTAAISLSSGNISAGSVVGFATFAQNDWATLNANGNVVPMNTYVPTLGSGSNTSLTGNLSTGAVVTNSLRFGAPSALTFTSATAQLQLSTGGILVPASNTGANSIGITGTAGKLNSSTGEIVVNDYGSGVLTIASVISGSSLTKTGPGTLVLSGANTYTGTTYIDGGTVQITANNNLGANGAPVYINGGTLSAQTGSIGTFNNASAAPLHPMTIGPAGAIFNFGINVTYQGTGLSGTGSIYKTGAGTWSVGSNASTFNGVVTVAQGIAKFTSSQFGKVTGFTVLPGAQYQINDDATATFGFAAGAPMTLGGSGPATTTPGAFVVTDQSPTGGVPGGPNETFSNPITLTSDTTFGIYNATDNNTTGTAGRISQLTLNGAISGPGNLIKTGSGVLTLANASDAYGGTNGTTSVVAGTIKSGVANALAVTSTLQFGQAGSAAAGTFDLNGFDQTLAGVTVISGAGHQLINSSTTTGSNLTINYSGTAGETFTGQLGGGTTGSPTSNNISLVKTGTGTFSLLGSTTYSGAANVSAGALRVTGNTIARPYIVNDGATLIVTNTDGTPLPATSLTLGNTGTSNLSFEFNGNVPTSGALAVSGSNGLTANGTVKVAVSSVTPLTVGQFPLITYSGSLQGAGFGAFNPNVALPSRVLGTLVNDTANNSIDLDITGVDFLVWNGNQNSNWDINTTANFKLNSNGQATTYLDTPSPDTVVFNDSASGTHAVNLTTTLHPASVTVNSSGDYTFTGTGSIAGTTGLTKTGTSTLNVLTNNTYTGTTTINGGTIVVGNGGTTGSLGTGAVVDNASLVFNRSDDFTYAGTVNGTGSITKGGSNNLTFSGPVNIGGGLAIAGGSAILTGSDSVVGDVTGPGTLNISQGTLVVGNGGTTGTVQTNVVFANNGTLAFNRSDSSTFTGSLTGPGNLSILNGSLKLTGSLAFTGVTTIGANTLEVSNATDESMTGLIVGTGNFIKSGAGQLTITGNDTNFTGNMTLNAGTILLKDPTAAGLGGNINAQLITINNTARFIFGEGDIVGENPNFPNSTFILINTGGTYESRVGETWGATDVNGGTLLMDPGSVNFQATDGGPFYGLSIQSGTVQATAATTITAANSGGGIIKTTSATAYFLGPITTSAATPVYIDAGTLSFQAAAIPGNGTAAIQFGDGNNTGTLQMVDSASATTNRPIMITSSGGVVDIEPFNGSAGTLTFSGPVSGSGALNKIGAGTLALNSTTNSYTGVTNISAGTLNLGYKANINTSPVVTVSGGATFGVLGSTANTASGVYVQNLPIVNINAGGQLIAAPSSLSANRNVIVPQTLSIAGNTNAWTGKVDLGNNDLDLANVTLAQVTNQLKQGFNNGTWNNTGGITSASAAADTSHLTALGVIVNNVNGSQLYGGSLGTFDTLSPAATDVLVKYTYYGDTDLSGAVDGSDYSRIDASYADELSTQSQISGWFNGDFNYDGVVDGSDYTLIDNAYNSQGAQFTASVASQISGTSAVPEPASLAMLSIAGLGLLGRRRRA